MVSFMARAFALARRAQGRTNPNPPVGAVVVREGRIVGQGATQPAGSWHAEVMALRQAGEGARGAALYLTLEPCAHHGRTPPCTEAIVQAGIAQVHIAMTDPNPQAGGGRQRLEAAGISVQVGEGSEAARALYASHIKHKTTGTPWVIAKFAMSLDGKIATRDRESQWITGPRAREAAHRLRAQVDAIAVGAGTVLADDPQLTARPGGRLWPRQPLRVVVDAAGRAPPEAQLFHQPGPSLLVTAAQLSADRQRAYREAGVETVGVGSKDGLLVLPELLALLGRREVTSLLVEGGGALLGSFSDHRLVDQVYAFIAPIVIGGAEAVPAVGGTGVRRIEEALTLERVIWRRLGDDLLVSGYTRHFD